MGNLLRTNENWHRSLISKMGNGFALTEIIFDRDKKPADCLFLDVNPAFEKMTAVNAIDLVAKKVGIVFPGTESFWVDQCGQVALTGISLQFKNYAKLLGRHFEVIACSLGKGLVATFFSDITERMRIEEAYHESERKYRAIAENANDGTLIGLRENFEEKQKELMHHQLELERANKELVQMNTALSVLARNIDRKRDDLEKTIAKTISSQIMPIINELKNDTLFEKIRVKLDVLEAYLNDLTPGTLRGNDVIVSLSAMELRVAMMIKKGFTSEDIARLLHISPHTVKTHRRSIRKKLNLKSENINLASYLSLKFGNANSMDV